MAQGNQTPQVPGTDVLLDTLRHSNITDEQRQQMWDAYTKPKTEQDFIQSMRGLPVNDDVRQNLYDMRYKGWKNQGNQPQQQPKPTPTSPAPQAAPTQTPQAKGDVRPSVEDVMLKRANDIIAPYSEAWKGISDQVMGGVHALTHGFSPEELQQGGQLARDISPSGEPLGTMGEYLGATLNRVGQVGQGLMAGAAAPFTMPLASIQPQISQITKPAEQLPAQVLGMGKTNAQGEYTVGNASEDALLRNIGGLAPFVLMGGAYERAAENPNHPVVNPKTGQVVPRQFSQSTSPGPISETGGAGVQQAVTAAPPTEAHEPQTEVPLVTKSANIEVPNRADLIAPNPANYAGAETPVPLTRFPKAVREGFAQGGTQGLGKIDLTTRTPVGGIKFTVEKDGVLWAKDSNGVSVSIPQSVSEADRPAYAARKIAEQAEMQAAIKSQVAVVGEPKPEVKPIAATDLHGVFNKIADLSRQADLSENDDHAANLRSTHDEIEAETKAAIAQHLADLGPGAVKTFRDDALAEAQKAEAQSKAIKDTTDKTIKNRGVNEDLTAIMSTGGPARELVINAEGDRAYVKPTAEAGPGFRMLIQTMRGEVPRYEYKIKGVPEGMDADEWTKGLAFSLQRREEVVGHLTDAIEIARDTGTSVSENPQVKDWEEELRGIDNTYGEYVDKEPNKQQVLGSGFVGKGIGRRPKVAPELDENGAIKEGPALQKWSLASARLAISPMLQSIPTDEEFYQHADMRAEKGQLFRDVADIADNELKNRKKVTQGGYLNKTGPELKGTVKPVSLADRVPDDKVLMARANQRGFLSRSISDEFPAGFVGFISKDGKTWIDIGMGTSHNRAAQTLLPEMAQSSMATASQQALRAMMEKGWIRKAAPNVYESWHIEDPHVGKAIDMDILRNRMTNRTIYFSTKIGERNVDLEITPDEMEKAKGDFRTAAERALRKANPEQGTSMAFNLGTGAAGAAAGAHLGAAIGGAPGAVLGGMGGFIVGFTAPEVLDNPRVKTAIKQIAPMLQSVGMKPSEWLNGPPQLEYQSPRLTAIVAEQNMHMNRSTDWVTRLKQLPPQLAKGIDPFVYVADRQNMGFLARGLMSFDKSGEVFRDLKVPDTQSLYLALRDAQGRSYGQRWYQQMQYNDIKADASKTGLADSLVKYLNLKGYDRTFQVLNEHMQDLNQKMNETQSQLADPNNTVRETAALQDRFKNLQKMHSEMDNKVKNGEATPGGYTPQTLQQEWQNFQQWAGVNNWTKLNALADRTFQARAHILDLLHSNGIVSDEDYQTYKARGPEYVPMERIMDDLENGGFHSATQPLHLRQQTVIKTLEGSMRANVNPWEGFAHADAKAFNQIIRNDTVRHALDLAAAYPETIGQEFNEVEQGYRPKAGEKIIGHYEEGKPRLYAVPSYLGDVMERYPGATKSALGAFASWFGHQWKRGATVYNLSFQAASMLSHATTGLMLNESNSKDVGRFVDGWRKSIGSVLTKDPVFREMVRSGAAFGGFQQALDPEYFASPSSMGIPEKLAKFKWLEAGQDIAAMIENINRTNTWRNAKLDGHSDRAAAIEAKYHSGAPDFSRMGDISQPLNQVFMFANAHMQYITQAMEALRKDPKRIGGVLVATAAAAIALQGWNAQQKDSDGNSLLRKVTTEERLRNWVVLTPWTHNVNGVEKAYQLNIPKPYVAQLMVNPVEQAAANVIGQEDRTGTQQALDILGHMTPIPVRAEEGHLAQGIGQGVLSALHPIPKTLIEQVTNRNDFGTPIVPENQQKLEAQYQTAPNTPGVLQAMGKGGWRGAAGGAGIGAATGGMMGGWPGAGIGAAVGAGMGEAGMSPRRLQAGLSSMFASGATQTESYLNPFFEATQEMKDKTTPEDIARSAPVIGPAVSRFLGSPADQQQITAMNQFYNAAQAAQTPIATFEYLKKYQPEAAQAYMQAHQDELYQGAVANKLYAKMSELSTKEKEIQAATDIPAVEKQDMLKNLRAARQMVISTGMQMLRPNPQVPQASAYPGQGQGAPH